MENSENPFRGGGRGCKAGADGVYWGAKGGPPMKRILLLTTGGTIASRLTDEGLAPGLDGAALTHYLGALADS